jgi:hypothetical protein
LVDPLVIGRAKIRAFLFPPTVQRIFWQVFSTPCLLRLAADEGNLLFRDNAFLGHRRHEQAIGLFKKAL